MIDSLKTAAVSLDSRHDKDFRHMPIQIIFSPSSLPLTVSVFDAKVDGLCDGNQESQAGSSNRAPFVWNLDTSTNPASRRFNAYYRDGQL